MFSEGLEESIPMTYALDPEKAIWKGPNSEIIRRYPSESHSSYSTDTNEQKNTGNNNNNSGIINDIQTENRVLKFQISNNSVTKWAQGIYGRVKKEHANKNSIIDSNSSTTTNATATTTNNNSSKNNGSIIPTYKNANKKEDEEEEENKRKKQQEQEQEQNNENQNQSNNLVVQDTEMKDDDNNNIQSLQSLSSQKNEDEDIEML